MTLLKIQTDADTRNDQLEEAAQTCELLTKPNASAEWAMGTMDCARAIRAKKTIQIVVPSCTVH
jgi:hypothetical protein